MIIKYKYYWIKTLKFNKDKSYLDLKSELWKYIYNYNKVKVCYKLIF